MRADWQAPPPHPRFGSEKSADSWVGEVAPIILGSDGLKLQAVDDLGPARLCHPHAVGNLAECSTIGAHQCNRSEDSGYTDHQRGRAEPEKADEQQANADAHPGFRSHVDLAAALCAVTQVVDLSFEVGH